MGGRLAHFVEQWKEFTDNKWVLSIVRNGFRIPFQTKPPLSSVLIKMSQSSSPLLREEIEVLLRKRAVERLQNLGTHSFYSRIYLIPKKNGKLWPIIDLSLLKRYIKKESFKMETVKSVRKLMLNNNWAVSIDLTNSYLHIPIHPRSRKYLRFAYEDQILQFTALPFRMSLSWWIFTKLMGVIALHLRHPHHLGVSIPRRLANKRSDSQSINISNKILPSSLSDSRFYSKPKEISINSQSEFHAHRHGISDPGKFSQGPMGMSRDLNTDYQFNSVMQTSIGKNFPFCFGQTQCSSRFCFPRQTALTSPANVSFVCLEATYSTPRSSDHNQRHDSIPFTIVDEYQSIRSRNLYPPSRPQHIPVYGCQSLWMGSSFRANETILSWSLDGRAIPASYQHVRNDGHTLSTETSHNIYSPFLCHDIHRQHDSGIIYQQTGRNPFSRSVRRGLGDPQFLPGSRYRNQSLSYPRQIQHFGRMPIEIGQTNQNRMGTGLICSEFSIPDAQISQCGFVCDSFQSQTPVVYFLSSRQPCVSSRCSLHELELSLCICISSYNSDTLCSRKDLSASVQNSSNSSILAPANVVPKTSKASSVSPNSSATISRTSATVKRKISASKPPSPQPIAWELSNNQSEIENFCKTLQISSQNQEEHLLRRSMT